MKDPQKVLLPSSNFVVITFGEGELVDRIPFALLDDLPLDLIQGPAIESVGKWITLRAYYWSGLTQ